MKLSHKILFGMVAILILSSISLFKARAASTCYPSSAVCLTLAQGIHDVGNLGGKYWYPSVRSWTTNPALNLDDIGYGYWNIKHGCNGVWTWGWTSSIGEVEHYTSNFYRSKTILKPACSNPNARTGYSGGTHDYYKYPYSHMYFFTQYSRAIP
ncbi:MAG: hypothetical protein H3C52_12940 [Anaerolineales bacterium]|jgi:hypothetical protein|nr:hypothetical protein [Anaerolineales bacterium]